MDLFRIIDLWPPFSRADDLPILNALTISIQASRIEYRIFASRPAKAIVASVPDHRIFMSRPSNLILAKRETHEVEP